MWDVAGMLPLITCDGLPFPRRLWVDSAFQAEDKQADRVTNGTISVDLDAVGITVNNGGTAGQRLFADGEIKCSLLNNAATATLSNNGGIFGQVFAKQDIVLTAGEQTLTRPTEAKDSISLISCVSPNGRYVTAHTPSVDNSSSVAGGLWVIQQTGFPGYTNQPILGLQNYPLGSVHARLPDALSWACSTAVFRNGELVGTATAQRGSVTPQFASRSLGYASGWQWAYSANHPIETLRGYVFPTIFGDTAALNASIDIRVPSQYRAFVVTFRVGHVLYNYSPSVGVIVRGDGFSYLSPPDNDAYYSPGQYRGPFFIPAGGTITVVIPHAIDGDIDPLGEINATQFDGLMDASQWALLTQEEGSYLCVSTSTDACNPTNLLDPVAHVVMQGPRFSWPPVPGSGKNSAQQATIFNSFVIDKTPPPLWWNVFDDMTVAEAAQKTSQDWRLANSIRSDEPIGNAFSLPSAGSENGDFGEIAASSRWTPKHYRLMKFPFQQQANFDWQQDFQTLTPGQYTISAVDTVTDAASNAAIEQPSVTFNVFEGTEDELRGRPHFEIPFEPNAVFGGREYPVTQIDVVFDGNVYGFTKRHFELKGFGRYLDKSVAPPQLANGEIPQLMYEFPPDQQNDNKTEMDRIAPRGITKVEQLSNTRVRLTLDAAMQFPGSRWRLFFTPDKQVFQFDEPPQGFELEYKHTPAFRAESGRLVGETQLWQIRFSDGVAWPLQWDLDSKKWKIQWGGVDYNAGDQIDSEDPLAGDLQSVGFWIKAQKQVQMACRANWVAVRPSTMMPQRIDTFSELIGIGGVSSVTTEIQEPESDGQHWRSQIAASGSMWLSKTPGTFQSGSPDSVDAFVPSVPPSTTAATNEPHSYWGLNTTIYPSTPRRLRSCKAPKSHQPQASVFHGGDNFGIQATLSRVVVHGSDGPPAVPGPGIRGIPGLFGPVPYSFSPILIDGRFLYEGGTDVDQFVTLFHNLSFSATGVPNRWSSQPTATANIGTFVSALRIDRTPMKELRDIYGSSTETSLKLVDGTTFSFGETTPIIAGCGLFTLQARRNCVQYRGLQTAVPSEITITISGSAGYNGASGKVPRLYNNELKAWTFNTVGVAGANATYTANLVLSLEQEASLVAGQSVAVVSDKLSENYFSAGAPGEPPSFFYYASRHVWTLQRI